MMPSPSTTSAMNPYWPIEPLSLSIWLRLADHFLAPTAQSSDPNSSGVPPPPGVAPSILVSAPLGPLLPRAARADHQRQQVILARMCCACRGSRFPALQLARPRGGIGVDDRVVQIALERLRYRHRSRLPEAAHIVVRKAAADDQHAFVPQGCHCPARGDVL